MNVAKLLQKLARVVPEHRLLEIYPLFLILGLKVRSISDDYRSIHVVVPLRWLSKNMHGTMFGGVLTAVSDPLAALLAEKQFPGVEVWTKSHTVEFVRPATTEVHLKVEVAEADVQAVGAALEAKGRHVHEFRYDFTDTKGHVIAHVTNSVFFRYADKRSFREAAESGEGAPDPVLVEPSGRRQR